MSFVLGTVQFGMNYGIQGRLKPSEEMVNEMLSLALEKKVEHFDTAFSYGNAEDLLGQYRIKNPDMAEKMHIISKLSPKALAGRPKDMWKDIILKNSIQSIKRLNVNELEAYLFHNAEYIFDEYAVQALHFACEENLAKKIGVSIYTPEEAMKALEYDQIKVIQVPYNVFDQRLDQYGFFGAAKEKGVEVYARSSLLQGLLLIDPDYLPENVRFARRYIERFLTICREYRISPLKAAIGFVKEHTGIDYVVFGTDNKAQLREYLSIHKEKLTEGLIKVLKKEFEDTEEKLVNPILWSK